MEKVNGNSIFHNQLKPKINYLEIGTRMSKNRCRIHLNVNVFKYLIRPGTQLEFRAWIENISYHNTLHVSFKTTKKYFNNWNTIP